MLFPSTDSGARALQTPCLVYEHMAGGSLASLLGDPQRAIAFGAKQRLLVATDVAHALAYLHEGGCGASPSENPRVKHAVVLHRDVNSSNVLLDGDLRGKLGDFGLCAMVHQVSACLPACLPIYVRVCVGARHGAPGVPFLSRPMLGVLHA